jgi:UDP-N-acetylglucosamine--N-acetylmuramyl-(pentapeptide) pyrophosphoryl-undecaprenol N-acetylglucosamine transferase
MSWRQQIALSVGGTYGHLFPALQALRVSKDHFFFIGIGLDSSPFLKQTICEMISLDGGRRFTKLLKSCWQAFIAFQKKDPRFVIVFGSYHSFPAGIAALILGKPIWVFEPNATMGKVNRFFSFFAHKILCYDETLVKKFPNRGFLMRPELEIKERSSLFSSFGLAQKKPVLLIIGGSSGSEFLNGWAYKNVDGLEQFDVIHLVGPKNDPELFKKRYKEKNITAYVETFINTLHDAMQIADIALTRGGASTLKELLFYQVPALIVPFEGAYQHQKNNALHFIDQGGVATIKPEKEVDTILDALLALKSQKRGDEVRIRGVLWSDIISLA